MTKRVGYIDGRRLGGWSFPATASPGNGQVLTIADNAVITTGNLRGLFVDYTQGGAKTGASTEVDAIGINLNVAADVPYVYGLSIYTEPNKDDEDPTMIFCAPIAIYSEDLGSATCQYYVMVDLGKNSTNVASVVDAFIRMKTHAGTTTSGIYVDGKQSYFLDFADIEGPCTAGDAATSGPKAWKISVRCGEDQGYIQVYGAS